LYRYNEARFFKNKYRAIDEEETQQQQRRRQGQEKSADLAAAAAPSSSTTSSSTAAATREVKLGFRRGAAANYATSPDLGTLGL
jgi:hypothetical protein